MKKILVLLVGALFVLGACNSASISAEKAEESVTRATGSVRTAEKSFEGTPYRLDNRGKGGWEVDLVDNGTVTEVRTNPKGNKVKRDRSMGSIDPNIAEFLTGAEVHIVDAIIKAAGKSKGYVMRAELSLYEGNLVWVVNFDDDLTGVIVRVDAKTAKIVDVDQW